jgi:hypothetical protein
VGISHKRFGGVFKQFAEKLLVIRAAYKHLPYVVMVYYLATIPNLWAE